MNIKYNTKKTNIIYSALRNYATRQEASELAGIQYKTFHEWYINHEEFKNEVDSIMENNDEKRADNALKVIQNAMEKTPKWAAWYLERTKSDKYGRSIKMDQDINIESVDIKYINPE